MSTTEHSSNGHDTDGKMADPTPEQSQDAAATNAQQKRKASSSPMPTEDATLKSPKRAKVDSEKAHHRIEPQPPSIKESDKDRREIARLEEKKRGRRLLGGLMNTLSQASAGSQHKKRQDIERRQQAKSTQQRAEDDRLRMQKLAKLETVRKAEQLKFDEQVMKTKHADMLAKAHYLQTRARPKIYYLPWELTRTQEDEIKDQLQGVEKIIAKEISEFKERKNQRLRALGIAVKSPVSEKQEIVGKPHDEQPADKPHHETTNRPPSRATNKVGPEKESDRADDVMIEEDEDTVIY
ncbi:hypothetical protein F5Y19DRAFT_132592 [Xylariaceae sp. FL1651]|nr:hypothetical protein F5Y19DRAFT_132592 [Xylariaceae sp. FL1651]